MEPSAKSIFVKCFNCGAMLLQCGKCRFPLFFLNIVVVVVVVVVGEWGPVICMGKVCIDCFYFTVLHFCCYWKPLAPSTWLGRLPIGGSFGSIYFQFPTLTFGTIGVYFDAMFAFCRIFAHFNPRLLSCCRTLRLAVCCRCCRRCCRCHWQSLTQQFDQFGHIVIICFNNLFQLLGVSFGKVFK